MWDVIVLIPDNCLTWSALKIARLAYDRISLVSFGQTSNATPATLQKPSTLISHCVECSLLTHGRCQQYWLFYSHFNVGHPSRLCAYGQGFP